MSNIIIYRSKSGYTKRYMEMLSKSVDAKLVEQSHMGSIDISSFERIIYAAGVYAGKISGLKKFVTKLNTEAIDNLAIVAVGASPTTEVTIEKLIKDNLISDSIIKRGAFFYLQGGFDPDKLNFALRAMLGSVAKKLSKKQKEAPETLTQEDIDFLNFFQTSNDQTSEEQLTPLIDYLGQETANDLFRIRKTYIQGLERRGFAGFHKANLNLGFDPFIEIGWRLKKEAWGCGYASEGAARCLAYGFETLGFTDVYSFTSIVNTRSERVMQKIGMHQMLDFDHPRIDEAHLLRPHVLYHVRLSKRKER